MCVLVAESSASAHGPNLPRDRLFGGDGTQVAHSVDVQPAQKGRQRFVVGRLRGFSHFRVAGATWRDAVTASWFGERDRSTGEILQGRVLTQRHRAWTRAWRRFGQLGRTSCLFAMGGSAIAWAGPRLHGRHVEVAFNIRTRPSGSNALSLLFGREVRKRGHPAGGFERVSTCVPVLVQALSTVVGVDSRCAVCSSWQLEILDEK